MIACPVCSRGQSVELNQDGYYECRICHLQFSRAEKDLGAEGQLERLYDNTTDQYLRVAVLSTKGGGDFPVDKEIAKVRHALKRHRKPKTA
jgi:hypothetical protein